MYQDAVVFTFIRAANKSLTIQGRGEVGARLYLRGLKPELRLGDLV